MGFGAVADDNGRIYSVGGRDTTAIEVYDPDDPEAGWMHVTDVPTARGFLSAAYLDGKIYAIGGEALDRDDLTGAFPLNRREIEAFNTVEVYDLGTGQWSSVSPMPTPRAAAAVAVARIPVPGEGSKRVIAVFGGRARPADEVGAGDLPRVDQIPGSGRQGLSTVEMYDPATDTWSGSDDPLAGASGLEPMPTPRSALAAAVAANGEVYLLGGLNREGTAAVNIVEVYDPATDAWRSALPLGAVRSGLGAAFMPDGRLFAIGGSPGGSGTRADVEALNSDGEWAPVAPMAFARSALSAVTGHDGRIYAIGGADSGTSEGDVGAVVEAYPGGGLSSPPGSCVSNATDGWATVAPLGTPRLNLGVASLSGAVYAVGGIHASTREVVATVEVCDQVSGDHWKYRRPMSEARADVANAAAPGADGLERLYVFGGRARTSCPTLGCEVLDSVEAYDPHTNTWSSRSRMPMARYGHAAVLSSGRIYIFGGVSSQGVMLSTIDAYDPLTDSWTSITDPPNPMPTARTRLQALAVPDGRTYVFGGLVDNGTGTWVASTKVEAYEPQSDTWLSVSPMPHARAGFGAAFDAFGRVHLIGYSNDVDFYAPGEDLWGEGPSVPGEDFNDFGAATDTVGRIYFVGSSVRVLTPVARVYRSGSCAPTPASPKLDQWGLVDLPEGFRSYAGASGRDGRIYLFGSEGDFAGDAKLTMAYDPVAGIWEKRASMPTARWLPSAVTAADGLIYVIGGDDRRPIGEGGRVVEAYDPCTDVWKRVAPTAISRIGSAATAGPDGRIYVMGGGTLALGAANMVEALDPRTGQWTLLPPMSQPRTQFGASAGADGRVYAIGGNQTGQVDTVEAFNPCSQTWAPVAPLNGNSSEVTAALAGDGRIYAFGDFSSLKVQVFDAGHPERWDEVETPYGFQDHSRATTGADGQVYIIQNRWLFWYAPDMRPGRVASAAPACPPVNVSDPEPVAETSGTASFVVSLDGAASTPVLVRYTTADGSARAVDGDYRSAAGSLVFVPGETEKAVSVEVIPDDAIEADESFLLNISLEGPIVGAVIGDSQAVATIVDATDRAPVVTTPNTSTTTSTIATTAPTTISTTTGHVAATTSTTSVVPTTAPSRAGSSTPRPPNSQSLEPKPFEPSVDRTSPSEPFTLLQAPLAAAAIPGTQKPPFMPSALSQPLGSAQGSAHSQIQQQIQQQLQLQAQAALLVERQRQLQSERVLLPYRRDQDLGEYAASQRYPVGPATPAALMVFVAIATLRCRQSVAQILRRRSLSRLPQNRHLLHVMYVSSRQLRIRKKYAHRSWRS